VKIEMTDEVIVEATILHQIAIAVKERHKKYNPHYSCKVIHGLLKLRNQTENRTFFECYGDGIKVIFIDDVICITENEYPGTYTNYYEFSISDPNYINKVVNKISECIENSAWGLDIIH